MLALFYDSVFAFTRSHFYSKLTISLKLHQRLCQGVEWFTLTTETWAGNLILNPGLVDKSDKKLLTRLANQLLSVVRLFTVTSSLTNKTHPLPLISTERILISTWKTRLTLNLQTVKSLFEPLN